MTVPILILHYINRIVLTVLFWAISTHWIFRMGVYYVFVEDAADSSFELGLEIQDRYDF